ncbi:hypothetical protein ACFYWF_31595 [Streptomyces sp. NPDC003344]|uniref:hypothetical protein n=1 Tax=Streptomyces sp. NPDC003344 TaxID=3364682 RepID=UPI003680E16F
MTEQNPEQPHPAELELARLRAGLTAGLTVEQSARIQGSTPEEMAEDATAFAAELGAGAAAPSAPLVGGPRGGDVTGHTAGSLAAGADAYRRKHGLDEDGRRPERRPLPTDGRNPFAASSYNMER